MSDFVYCLYAFQVLFYQHVITMKYIRGICIAFLFLSGITLPYGCLRTNSPPLAIFTCLPSTGDVPLTVSFDATSSSDPDGNLVSYAWEFGDSEVGSGATASHVYGSAGTYTVILTVTDDDGATASTSAIIQADASPCTHCAKITEWRFGVNSRGAPAVSGILRNDCSYRLSYVQVYAHFYDAADIEIGTYWDIIAGMLIGEEWGFEIECPISAVWPYVDHATVEVHACTAAP